MLESLVASILNRVLKDYVSNLNYDQLKIGMWKGEVNLRDLKLRKDALDKLQLPINVSEGCLGELTLIIPWSNLRSKPVKVIIDHVYLLVEPRNEATVTVEEEEARIQELKHRRLSTAEMLEASTAQQQPQQNHQQQGNDGFISQLTTKIIDNLQFTMKNIHIRYEDTLSDQGHPFAVGITLKELSALSTDENWIPKFISDPTNTINKLAMLESLSVYWNTDSQSLAGMQLEKAKQAFTNLIPISSNLPGEHQYILKPVSGTGKVKINKKYGGDVPKTDISLLFDQFAFELDDRQYQDAILMIDLLHASLKKQKYLKFHPSKEKTPRSHPREYFQFAAKAIISEIHERNYKWSWDHFRTRRDQRLQYIECYTADKIGSATPQQKERLKELEYELSFEDIRFYRSIAKTKIRRERVVQKKSENKTTGWWSWLTGATTNDSNNATDDDTESIYMTEEQKKELYDAIEYDEDKASIINAIDIPKDSIKFSLKTNLNRGSFTLKQNIRKPTEIELLSLVFDEVSIDVTQYVESMKIAATLGDLQLFDGATKDTIYHQLIGVKNKINRETSSLLNVKYNMTEKQRRNSILIDHHHDPFFSIVFEKKPLTQQADNAISIKMRHLEIIYSPIVIAGVRDFLKPPSSKMESVNALIAVAEDTFEGLKIQTRAGLEFALEIHETLDLNVDMDAPIIIIPESLTSQDSSVLVIDAGHINIDSQLADKKILNDIKAKDITKYSKEDIQTLESLMYDKFNLQLSQTKVLVGRNTREIQDASSRLIERIDMNFLLELCILPGKTEFTKFKVSGHLPLLSINLSDTKYKILMKVIDFIVPSSNNSEQVVVTKPRINSSNDNLLGKRFWSSRSNEVLLVDSANEEVASVRSQSDTVVGSQYGTNMDLYESEQFKLMFQVDKVSAAIHESNNSDLGEVLLCELVLESFTLVVLTRPDDMLVDVTLKALSIADKMEHTGPFDYLVLSETTNQDKNLVNVAYRKASRTHPHFEDMYDGYDQTVDVVLSTLTVIMSRKSILKLYNWIMNTFTTPQQTNQSEGIFDGDVSYDDTSFATNKSILSIPLPNSKQASNSQNDSRMKVGIHMDGVNLVLNNEGSSLGTISLSFGELIILLLPKTIEVNGKFGNFTLTDDSSPKRHQTISILDNSLADFTYKTYDPESKQFPGYHQKFVLRIGSIQLFVNDSIKPTLTFLQDFLEMKSVYDAARTAALETAQQYQGVRFHFDVVVKSPILIFPVAESDNLIAYLGEIRAKNTFVNVRRRNLRKIFESSMVPVNHISCGLYDISLRSTQGTNQDNFLPIIDDLNIIFNIENPEDTKEMTGMQILGEVSDVRMTLTDQQYKSLLEVWEFIQSNFLTGKDDVNQPTESENSMITSTSISTKSINTVEAPTINLNLSVVLKMICLEIKTGDHPLSKLAFNGIHMKLQTMSNESMLMEVSMQSVSFSDTREQSKSQFREVLPASTTDGYQFQLKLCSYKNTELIPTMDIKVTVDSPKIVLSLDYLFLLKDFFMNPFIIKKPTEAQKFAQLHGRNSKNMIAKKQQQLNEQQVITVVKYNVNIVDLQIFCLANPEKLSSEAVILSFKQFIVIQDACLDAYLDGIGMVLCRMDNITESTMHFVESFKVSMKMETAAAGSVHNLTSIKLNLEPIILRLSYQDVMLIMTIANKMTTLMSASAEQTPSDSTSQFYDISTESSLPVPGEVRVPTNAISKPIEIGPYITMSKELLTASFEGLQIILIEDLHDLPFMDFQVDPFTITVSDWSRLLEAEVNFSLKANNFNFKNSHWEPIIEPWDLYIHVSKDAADQSMNLSFESQKPLNVNISHNFLETLLTISETLSQTKPIAQTAQNQVRPYLIRNFTGYDLRFWNMSDDVKKGDTRVYTLPQGESLPWTFRDWKQRRERTNLGNNLFGLQIDKYNWESLIHVPVDTEGERSYRLQPNINGIYHRLIVDIHLENHVKTVTFRSGLVLENKSAYTLQVALVNKDRRILTSASLKAGEPFYVPIEQSYSQWFVVRPSDEYHWSSKMLMWSDLMLPSCPKYIECLSFNSGSLCRFQVHAEFDKRNPLVKQYPFMKVYFSPPIEVENLLPFDFDLILTNELTNEKLTTYVSKGEIAQVHDMKSDAALVIAIDIKSERYKCSDPTIIRTKPYDYIIGEKLVVNDQNDIQIILQMNLTRSRDNDALHISIYAPYLIFNKTGLPVCLRKRQNVYHQAQQPVEHIPAYIEGDIVEPVIFSYPGVDNRNRAQISINDSKWSEPISFEAVGNSQDVTLHSKYDKLARHAGIKVEEGVGILRLTKVVTITPRYILKNKMSVGLKFCEFGMEDVSEIAAGQKMVLYQTSHSHVRWLCLQLQHLENTWSSPVDIQEIGKTFVKVDKEDRTIPYLVRVSVHIKDSTLFITFNEDDDWPYYIVNNSSVDVQFRQKPIDFEDYDLKKSQKKAFQEPRLFNLAPGEKLKYSWDIPIAKEKRLQLFVGDRHRSINFQAIGAQIPFRYYKQQQRGDSVGNNTLSIDIKADESALVLLLTDFDLSKSLYRPNSSGTSTLASSSREGSVRDTFETVNIQHIVNFSFELKLAEFGLSLINRHVQEVAFATIKGLGFKYIDSNLYQSIRLSIQWLQIDNQLYNSTYPILCYPTTLPKAPAELVTHPTLHIALDKVKDDKHGVLYFKLFSILLQEMTFEIDETFLYAMLDFTQFENSLKKNNNNENDLFVMKIEEPAADKAEALYYFEEFCIQPMRLNLSLVKTDRNDDNTKDSTKSSPFGYVFNVFTMTLGNINDAPIKLNALMVDNLRASSEDLTARILMHYREQIIYQVHRVLGSIDIFGNPVGFFSTLSSGFGELFYEPYQGFIMSDRPQDLGIGIAKGVGGFMRKGVFGISDSMSRFTGSLGKGLSVATMDKKFQDRRRMNMTRNKPTHAIYGVTQGVGYFGTSIASGFAGLVKRPIEGAEESGVVGFMGGVGKGIVGVFTKPVVGFLDMATNVTAGIRETTTVFEGGGICRERLPRYTGKDGIVTVYSQREALGQMWLKQMESGKYANETYIAHSIVDNDETIVILTYTRILLIQSDNLKLNYGVLLDKIESVESEIDGVYLHLKNVSTRILRIHNETSRMWFAGIIKETMAQRKEERERQ
ncbi:uncharacterized protein BX663DRAFT_555462 [Cokeromyces recurvatus]|uniref:uncharacterized protein n=1 Tax=Cokeromyces recurvatus TaxID=90255 RepID=UPI00221EB08D|nr:uncharacterized protein BX663DRAFT_555462 [Cokeromyces recurvatus]KAI7898920.1 hypothetical protein BX663DRAFT_555462 [Cokeromyces recurvatus]